MQNRKVIIGVVVVLAIIAIAAFFLNSKPEEVEVAKERVRKEIYNFDPAVCPGETVIVKMADQYLRGLVEEGTEVSTILNYFACAPIQRDDIVLYRFSEFDDPVFRRVVAIEGDKFDLTEVEPRAEQKVESKPEKSDSKLDSKTAARVPHKGWELSVNGKKVHGVKGETYSFGGPVPPPLKLAVAQNGGKLGKDQAIVFSAFPPGDRDSGVFGVVSVTDFVGKASIKSKK